MLLLFLNQGIAVNSTANIVLPINCQLAITDESTRGSQKWTAGNISQLGSEQFKSVFGE